MTERQERVAWIDLAKAVCILLVVLLHAQVFSRQIEWEVALPVQYLWNEFGRVFRPIRMPLFFLVSGVLAAPLLKRRWEEGVKLRAISLFWVYALWSLLVPCLILALVGSSQPGPLALARTIMTGQSEVWYLWALSAFVVLAWFSRKLPPPLIIAGALLFAVILSFPAKNAHGVMFRCLPFFMLGVHYSTILFAVASAANWRRLGVSFVTFLIAYVASSWWGSIVNPVCNLAGVWLGLLTSAMVVRSVSWIRGPSRWLAARTLPIYVLHFPVLAALGLLALRIPETFTRSTPVAILFPLLLAAASVSVSLATHHLLVRFGGAWLFALPKFRPSATAAGATAA